ncbi:MAG: VRR-NUC domain-containing protein [Pseudomonadota bacterium]
MVEAISNAAMPELPPHYYRDNFLALCDTVEAQYTDLLSETERQHLATFRQLSFDSQCLYIRLISRVGPWFRESKLSYPELGDIALCIDELLARRMVEQARALSIDEIAGLYTSTELKTAFVDELEGASSQNKRELMESIESLGRRKVKRIVRKLDASRIIAPCGLLEVELYQLLFFGNRGQSLTDFVLSELGIARYYPYRLDRKTRLFETRESLEEYIACGELSDVFYELRESGQVDLLPALAEQVLELETDYDSSKRRLHRLCNLLARDLERVDQLVLADKLYTLSDRHPARERRLRIMERQQQWSKAEQLAHDILDSPWCEEERDAAERILPRVLRKLGAKVASRPRDSFQRLDLRIKPGELCVEQLTALHLLDDWKQVHYVENSLMNTLFGLAFWDEIFHPIPGAFNNPFQSVPNDMYSAEFRRCRHDLIRKRLRQLRQRGAAKCLAEALNNYANYQCRWVDWRCIDAKLLNDVTRCIPDENLLSIWERILFDPGENRRGFPDLLALGNGPGDYCLIEVKGPGDALQESQKRWLRFFDKQAIPAAVAWVQWQEANAN